VDEEAFSAKLSRNHLYSYALSEMLDTRKAAQTPGDVEALAKKYNVDVGRLGRLVRFINSPSVDSSKIRKVDEKNEEKGMILPVSFFLSFLRCKKSILICIGYLDRTTLETKLVIWGFSSGKQ